MTRSLWLPVLTRSKREFLLPIGIAIVSLVFSAVVTGQSSQQAGDSVVLKGFLVEGKRPNFIEGGVQHVRGSETAALTLNQTFENGDMIRVAASGRAEILLVPGCYLRLDHNTRISLLDLSPDNLKLKLWSGSAILEVAIIDLWPGDEWQEQRRQLSYEPVSLLTPTAQYLAAGGGSYRLKVDDKGNSELSVVKGIAFVNGSRIDSGMTAAAAGGRVNLTGFKPVDDFDNWSRQRGKALVKANHVLEKSEWHKKVRSNRGYLLITDPEDPSRAKERLTVSAKTGVVDFVEDALVSRVETPAWRKLQTSERLLNGDRVKTAVESRAEIHVYPNCFLFLEGDTEIVYREVERQATVEIIKGSAIVILASDAGATEPAVLTIVADKSEYRISESGNYRIDIGTGAKPELMIYVGPTRVVSSEAARSKKPQPETMLKKITGDSFDVWAYRRSKLLTIRGFRRYFGPLGGMWYFVESTREYTFVPAAMDYSSPYGGTYSTAYGEPRSPYQRRRPTPVEDPLPVRP